MPRQAGSILITGSLDNVSFYHNKAHGYLARKKGGPGSERVKTDPAYERTRENNSEFGRASGYGRLLRKAFAPIIQPCQNHALNTNLSRRIREIILMDPVSERGKRDLTRDTLSHFRHFELEPASPSSGCFLFPVNTEMAGGLLEVTFGVALNYVPKQAAAWRLTSVKVTADFLAGTWSRDVKHSSMHEVLKGDAFAFGFTHDYEEDRLIFHGLCIEWYTRDKIINEYKLVTSPHVNAGFIRYVPG